MSGMWIGGMPLVLASKSAVRRALLESAGIPFDVVAADIDERAVEAQAGAKAPGDVALLLAQHKAEHISRQRPGRIIVGADQTLALGSKRFTKPVGRPSARRQLLELRGQTHKLYSAIALVRDGTVIDEMCEIASLTMRNFSEGFLDAYLDAAGATVCQSVGGYQLELLGVHCFERIEGDHTTILGLPLLSLLAALRKIGMVAD